MKRLPSISTERALKVLGGRWKTLILWQLGQGVAYLTELEAAIPGVSQKVLIQQLRVLEAHGLVARHGEKRTEYRLTTIGRGAIPMIESLSDWGREHALALGENVAPRCRRAPESARSS